MKQVLFTALALCIAAFPVIGQEATGRFSGTIDDAEQVWHVLTLDGVVSAGWEDENGAVMVRIRAFPDADGPADARPEGTVEIDLLFMGGRQVVRYLQVILHGPAGTLYANDVQNEIGESRFQREELRRDGDTLHLSGRLEAELFAIPRPGSTRFDTADRRSLKADIVLTLERRP